MFAIKAEISDPLAGQFSFSWQKTMYGGRHIAVGDPIFIFASENEGGCGLIAKGVVTLAELVPRLEHVARQTRRVSITVERIALSKRPLGRTELRAFATWNDSQPQTELNFKFYRQATNKIASVSDNASAFLDQYF